MYRVVEGTAGGLADVKEFLTALDLLDRHPADEARRVFSDDKDLIVTRAPWRLDVMGGIADYSGSLVLQLPIREGILVALQPDDERRIKIVSLGREADQRQTRVCEMRLEDFEQDGRPIDYAAARSLFKRDPQARWVAYVAGVFLVLMRERGIAEEHVRRVTYDNALKAFTAGGQMAESDWLSPPAIDQRTLFEGNSVLRGGQEPRVDAKRSAKERMLIE